jgi:hypothetical protein
LIYERGDPDHPVGHAFLYFRSVADDQIAATYLVAPPITIEFSKYVPPLLASTLGSSGLIAQTAFLPIPPIPEPMALDELRRLAEVRGDDVLVQSELSLADLTSLMSLVAEVGDAYARAYQDALARAPAVAVQRADEDKGLDANALLYSILSERERLDALAQRLGTLRYAVETDDAGLVAQTQAEMRAIGRYLPDHYAAVDLIAAASRSDAGGVRLAQLYIDRGYKLSNEDYEAVATLDAEIAALQRQVE